MRWFAVATAIALSACNASVEWRARLAQPVAPATTIAHVPSARTFALAPMPAPDFGCPLNDDGTRSGDLDPRVTIYRLCFPGLRKQFEHAVAAMLGGMLTPGDAASADYVARVKDFQLRTGVREGRVNYGSVVYVYELHWDVELVDREGTVVVDIKDVTRAGGAGWDAPATDELDDRLASSIVTAEGKILDTIRTALLASSAMQ